MNALPLDKGSKGEELMLEIRKRKGLKVEPVSSLFSLQMSSPANLTLFASTFSLSSPITTTSYKHLVSLGLFSWQHLLSLSVSSWSTSILCQSPVHVVISSQRAILCDGQKTLAMRNVDLFLLFSTKILLPRGCLCMLNTNQGL